MNFPKLLALSLLWIAADPCCRETPLYAQSENIKIRQTQEAVWDFPGAQMVGGRFVAPVDSKPKFDRVETTIKVETVVEYKYGEMKARRLPTYERVTLDEVGKGVYKFKPSAPEGAYLLEYSAFDPERGIASNEATIKLERVVVPDIEPNKPPTNDVERIVDNAMFEVRKGYASVFKRTADEMAAGRIKTDGDMLKFMVPLSKSAREQAVAGIDGLIQDKLPRDGITLKPEAPVFMREIAVAFERGLK